MQRDIDYYTLECKYTVHTLMKVEACSTCSGEGQVNKKKFGLKRCPSCKGKDSRTEVEVSHFRGDLQ